MSGMGDQSGAVKKLLEEPIYGLAALKALVDDLESRLTAARAGYLDNLNNSGLLKAGKYCWKNKSLTGDVKSPPVQNTEYTLLDVTDGVMLYSIVVNQYNDEEAAKTINLVLVADDETIDTSVMGDPSFAFNKQDDIYHEFSSDTLVPITETVGGTRLLINYFAPIIAHHISFKWTFKSVPGTNQEASVWARYATLEAV